MTNFADAFTRGQNAAAEAARARAEIDEIFDDAKRQLLAATNGNLELGIQEFPKPRSVADLVLGSAASLMANMKPQENEPWVAGRNPNAKDSGWIRLARWDRPQQGYPCQLIYDRTDVRCHDRDALADAIGELLANPAIGEKLHELLNRQLASIGE